MIAVVPGNSTGEEGSGEGCEVDSNSTIINDLATGKHNLDLECQDVKSVSTPRRRFLPCDAFEFGFFRSVKCFVPFFLLCYATCRRTVQRELPHVLYCGLAWAVDGGF